MNRIKEIYKSNAEYFIAFAFLLSLSALFLYFYSGGEELLFFSERRHSVLNGFFRVTNYLGEGYAYVGAGLLFLILRRYRKMLFVGILACAVLASTAVLKDYFGHPRPAIYFSELKAIPEVLKAVPGVKLEYSYTSSFPSGHTTAAFALYGFLAFSFRSPNFLKSFFLMLACLAGMSRIYLGQHFLSDVMAGSVLGTLLAILMYSLEKAISPKGSIPNL